MNTEFLKRSFPLPANLAAAAASNANANDEHANDNKHFGISFPVTTPAAEALIQDNIDENDDRNAESIHSDDVVDKKYPKRFGTKAQRFEGQKKTNDTRWMVFYERLKQFKEKHGHINVPCEEASLRGWCQVQREHYVFFMKLNNIKEAPPPAPKELEAPKSPLKEGDNDGNDNDKEPPKRKRNGSQFFDQKRIDLLNELGFKWKLVKTWDDHFERLAKFSILFGHSDVSKRTSDGEKEGYKAFVAWVQQQRVDMAELYSLMQTPKGRNKVEKMTKKDDNMKLKIERFQKLDKIGMIWNLKDKKWHDTYKVLLAYYKEHGNCEVSDRLVTDDGTKLGRWVRSQREQYQEIKKHKSTNMIRTSCLTVERLQLLIEIDFRFKPYATTVMDPTKECNSFRRVPKVTWDIGTQTEALERSNSAAQTTHTGDLAQQSSDKKPRRATKRRTKKDTTIDLNDSSSVEPSSIRKKQRTATAKSDSLARKNAKAKPGTAKKTNSAAKKSSNQTLSAGQKDQGIPAATLGKIVKVNTAAAKPGDAKKAGAVAKRIKEIDV